MPLEELLQQALERRAALLATLHGEDTDCYRILHGAVEGSPGLTIDRYGAVLLFQTWNRRLEPQQVSSLTELAEAVLGLPLEGVWNFRDGKKQRFNEYFPVQEDRACTGRELGIQYDVRPRHRGIDPLLFLDLRAGRRRLLQCAAGKEVLNLFSYTCGLGLAAARGGCREVVNVDFSASALDVGRHNADLNSLPAEQFKTIQADVLPTLRQLSGLGVKGRGRRRRPFARFEPRQFDLVLLDPPAWSKGAFGAVDVVRDYPSLFKPALLATRPGGSMLVTNNSARVTREDWLDVLQRSAAKAGRPIQELEFQRPEADFPSPDDRSPLKMAWLEV